MPEGEWTDADARVATSEDVGRETFNTPQQISICGSNTSERETLKPDVSERLEQLQKEFSASSGSIIQKEVPEKEKYEKLQERIRDLEARNEKLLSKVVSMHKQSENLNDPFRLSAVLNMYRMLKLHEWGKCWSSSAGLSYPKASNIIKELMPDIMKLLRYGYYHNDSGINKIIKHADVPLKNIDQEQFALKCCRVFCLLLLQDSPVKAVWNIRECSLQ
ncbi:uncharacterized protein LOC125692622 isoform X2 [Lagopus muta]|uniref:uncharacterized protein LOC125692622 isoform X2 n=1 Tax=Lagopus muta TaxID=64668 RepID=UPI00209D032C|nr:uncharacterized protein LOC125692622 isoform X2 [Lagopus muta]